MRTLRPLPIIACALFLAHSLQAQTSKGLFSDLTNNAAGNATPTTFSGELNIAGKSYTVVKYSFGLYRTVDGQGRPTGGANGGQVRVTLKGDRDASLWVMMNTPHRSVSGTLSMKRDDTGAAVRKIDIADAYVIEYSE